MVNPETNALETNVQTPLDNLSKTLEMLEKKEKVLVKKATVGAKEFTRAKNRRAAIQCLKRKRLYEQQIEQLGNFQSCILDQVRNHLDDNVLETTETVDALRTGAVAMKAMQKATFVEGNIDDVGKTMDEINGQTEYTKHILEALSAPIGAAADFHKDELKQEHEELEVAELEEQLLQPATTVPVAPLSVPAKQQPASTLSRLPFSGSSLPFSAEFLLLLLALVCMKLLSRMMSFIY